MLTLAIVTPFLLTKHASFDIGVRSYIDGQGLDWQCYVVYGITTTPKYAFLRGGESYPDACVVICDSRINKNALWQEWLQSFSGPIVRVYLHQQFDAPNSIGVDDKSIGMLAARHLREMGYRYAATIGDHCGYASRFYRISVFHEQWTKQGGILRKYLSPVIQSEPKDNESHIKLVREDMARWLVLQPKPLAIFCHNDKAARWLLDFIQDYGLPKGQSIGVLGVGDSTNVCTSRKPHVCSIIMPIRHLGMSAARCIHQLINNSPCEQSLVPATMVANRKSLPNQSPKNVIVKKALAIMSKQLVLSIDELDLETQIGKSRDTISRAFSQDFGCSIKEIQLRLRIREACRLLIGSHLPISTIANRVGYKSKIALDSIFKKKVGMTPHVYRIVSKE